MALFKLGAFAQALTGRSGNTVFSDTKNGTVVRDFVVPANPRTPGQQTVRGKFRQASVTFSNLPKAKVDAWNAYARGLTLLGRGNKRRQRTGVAVFNELATKFLLVNPTGTVPQDPPQAGFSGDVITLTATAGTGQVTFTASGPNAANVTTELLLQPLRNGNRKPLLGAYRSFGYFRFLPGSLTRSVTVPPGWYAAGYRFVQTQTGQATEIVQIGVSQVPLALAQGGRSRGQRAA